MNSLFCIKKINKNNPQFEEKMLLILLFFAIAASVKIVQVEQGNTEKFSTLDLRAVLLDALLCKSTAGDSHPIHFMAVDDFALSTNLSPDCDTLQFEFDTIYYSSNDDDPPVIYLALFYHKDSTAGPEETPFFLYSFVHTDCCWYKEPLGVPTSIQLTLKPGMENKAGGESFNLQNEKVWPRNKRLWVGFFGSVWRGAWNRYIGSYYDISWLTYYSLIPRELNLTENFKNTTVKNLSYKYRDFTNFLRLFSTQWIDAEYVQTLMGVQNTSLDMTWRLTIICHEKE